ncbi:MAG: hypothetical protein JOZ68_14640 [Acidimicrobiia bacterium]|nr:hypothetical protein [Acidimicrobiia bacterium]MBV8985442.1 hypothetical protein [Acidimicrobiia bacterium]MBV9042241.1 hypothetical protein [Acidimicrobiia bacterium]
MTDPGPEAFLADPQNPALNSATMMRIGDDSRPDRLAWNAFRTLALWQTDAWVPRLLDVGLGGERPIEDVEWEGASVQLWATGVDLERSVDVLIDGPNGLVICLATLDSSPTSDEARNAMLKAASDAALGGRRPAFLAVVPTRDDEGQLQALLEAAASGDDLDALTAAVGWVTWRELSEIALDLAEEEEDSLRADQVALLVDQLQARYPDLDL